MKTLLFLVLIAIIICSDNRPCEKFGFIYEENEGNNNFTMVPEWVSSDINSKSYFPRLMYWLKENKMNKNEEFLKAIVNRNLKKCSRFLPREPCCLLLGKYEEFSKFLN